MVEYDVNPYPIMLLVNFWEIRPAQMGARLDELRRKGVTQFATFVPWQVVESDITHTLSRFMQAVSDRKMKIFLILSPEVGIHYPNSGLPKDIMLKKENVAQDVRNGKISVHLPPNSFSLPSLFSPEFSKRYLSFLARMDSLFYDLKKNQPNVLKCVTAVLTGSLWKYYRSPQLSTQSAFGGNGGDYSTHAALAYRQRIESYFSQKEFTDPNPSAANRWKTRSLEEVNRRWFNQQSEDVFKHRSISMLRRKSTSLPVLEMELFTPEADPSLAYSNFLQMVTGGHADFSKLSKVIEELTIRCSMASTPSSATASAPFIHWTAMGGFRMMAEAEKQFLILKSLLLVGGQGGGILMDEAEWFSFSPQFRNRLEILCNAIIDGEFKLRNRVLYLAPHIWSSGGEILDELVARVGCGVKMISTLDLVLREGFARLVIVDPSYILTRETVQKLTAWAKAGRVVVLPRSPLYSESGRAELEHVLSHTKKIEVDMGMTYRLHALGDGKLVVYDVLDNFSLKGEPLSSLQNFLTAVLSIADVESYCRIGDSQLTVIPLERKNESVAVFVFNGTKKQVTADIVFSGDVKIEDLGAVLSGEEPEVEEEGDPSRANRYTLEVPPYGILPLQVEGLGLAEYRERQIAAMNSQKTRENAINAAVSELPGFTPGEEFGELWN